MSSQLLLAAAGATAAITVYASTKNCHSDTTAARNGTCVFGNIKSGIRDDVSDLFSAFKGTGKSAATHVREDAHRAADAVKRVGEEVSDDAHLAAHVVSYTAKNAVRSVGNEIRNATGYVGSTASDVTSSITDAVKEVAGDASATAQDAAQQVQDTVQSTGWFGRRKEVEQVTKEKAKEAGDWLDAKQKQAKAIAGDAAEDVKSRSKELNANLLAFGQNKAEQARAIAIGQLDRAHRAYDDAIARLESLEKPGFFSKASPEYERVKTLVAAAEAELENSKQRLASATDKVKSFTVDNYNRLADELHEQNKKSWFGSAIGVRNKDKVAADAVRGWGDLAQEMAKDELDALDESKNKLTAAEFAAKRDEIIQKVKDTLTAKGDLTEEQLAKRAANGMKGWGENATWFAEEEVQQAKGKN